MSERKPRRARPPPKPAISWRGQEYAARLYAIAETLGTANTREQVASVLVAQGMSALGATAGSVALINDAGDVLELIATAGYDAPLLEIERRFPVSAPFPLSDAVRTRHPVWLESPQAWAAHYPDLTPRATVLGPAAWAALPLQTADSVFGALGLAFARPQTFTPDIQSFGISLAKQGAQALHRALLSAALQQAQARGRLLEQLSQTLIASLDNATTARDLARLVLPALGDMAQVYILNQTGAVELTVVAHSDPQKEAMLRALVARHHAGPDYAESIVGRAIRSGEAFIDNNLSEWIVDPGLVPDRELRGLTPDFSLRSILVLPLGARGQTIGVLVMGRHASSAVYSTDEQALAREIGRRAALAFDNTRLFQQAQFLAANLEQRIQERTQALQTAYAHQRDLSDRLNRIRDEERARLAHEIRDELGGTLAGLKMDIVRLKRMAEAKRPSLPQELDALAGFIDQIMFTVRQMSLELYPSVLDDFGLPAALDWYLDQFRERSGLDCQLVVNAPGLALEHTIALQVFRVFQKALTNVSQYAQATQVRVALTLTGHFLVLEIRDNGRGIPDLDTARRRGFGLTAMNDRVLSLSGRLSITSTVGQGTSVLVEVPLQSSPPT